MESIGEKLKSARERNNLTIEQVARETHVARRFLKALEDEDFEVFPGETYAMGFLRNYAEYLGLNPDELIAIYRNIQIQEQPLPMNELLDARPKRPPLRLLIIAGGIVLVLALAGFIIYRAAARGADASGKPRTGTAADYVFSDESGTQWFSQGDGIAVPLGSKTYRVVIASVDSSLTLKVPGGTVDVGLGKERYIDLDGDSTPDLRIVWNDVDRSSSVKRVNLGLYRTTGTNAAAATAGDASAADAIPPAAPAGAATPPVRTVTFAPVTLAQAAQAGLFVLDFTFKNDCLFRYSVDDGQREPDRFFQKGEQFSIDTGRKQVTIWMSNAGAARMRVQGKDFELGALGEVATRRVAWRKDASTGTNVLELTALY
jgi:cytoskeletal protein RodZ